ncbi:glutamine synthetase [Saccharomonospora sp. NPDC006951]
MTKAASAAAKDLAADGVRGVHLSWADNNGIPRSRIVPVAGLADAAARGVGATSLFAVFDSHDRITYQHEGLATPSGDIRLIPVIERLRRLSGQPALAWAPARQSAADGTPWPYCQRTRLERQVAAAASEGIELLAGFELEFAVTSAEASDIVGFPGHRGPAYSPHALVQLDAFVAALLRDFDGNGLRIGQLHAEYGLAQLELSLVATDPVSAADDQLLARQTIHAAARAHGLKVSFAPLVSPYVPGNGWHLHTSPWRKGRNLLAGKENPVRPEGEGAAYLAGLLRELAAITAVTAPSVPSGARLRPGYFASGYTFWGVENREAPLRFVPGSALTGDGQANVELKPCDASANPYLALTAVLASGLGGIADRSELPESIGQDPGTWSAAQRERLGVARLPVTPAERAAALASSARIREALGERLFGAFSAVRASDAEWAQDKSLDEVVHAHLWRY